MGSPKLNDQKAAAIKRAMHTGTHPQALAYKYEVDISVIRSIYNGRYYKHVLPELTKVKRRYRWMTPAVRVKVLNAISRGKTYVQIGKEYDLHPAIIKRIKDGQ
jgi:hypothetical protein